MPWYENEDTPETIVNETTKAFAKQLEQIMKPVKGSHDFQFLSTSNIHVCMKCGREKTRTVMLADCNG